MKYLNICNKLLRYFSNMQLIKKFWILFIVAWILPMVFSSYYIYKKITYNSIESQIELARQGHQQVKSFLDYRLERIVLTCRTIAMDSKVNEILAKDIKYCTTSQQLKDLSTLRVYLEQFQSVQNKFDILRLYVLGDRIYANENKLVFNLDAVRDTVWYKKTFSEWGWTTYNPPNFMEIPNVVSVVQPIRDFNNYTRKIGAVRIDIPLGEIENMLKRASINNSSLTYMVTQDGILIAASSSQLFSIYKLDKKYLDKAISSNSSFIPIWDKGRKLWVCADNILDTGWILVTVLPEIELIKSINSMQLQYIIAFVLLFLLVVSINVPAINYITKRIELLVEQMKQVQEGNLSVHIEVKNHDEIGQLAENFNFMIDRIEELMEEQYIIGQELITAELKALQSQINPHFLHNTLETIGWLALEGNIQEVHSMVKKMAQFYRLSLSRGDDVVSIAEELELVKSYMYIQNVRFQNRIQLLIDVPEFIQQYSIPKITLQPLVENAIIHGILEKDSKSGCIQIVGRLDCNGMIELSVIDDGVGMDADKLEKLKNGDLLSSEGSSYGLSNINKRICLMFGIRQGLFFQSQRDVGTIVTLRIPPVQCKKI